MKKNIFLLIILIGIITFASTLFFQARSSNTHQSDSLATTDMLSIEMRILKGKWQWEPSEIRVPLNSKLVLNITNEDEYAHGFSLKEFGVDEYLTASRSTKVEFIADKEGEFEFQCSVLCGAGHFTQRGKLIVSKGGNNSSN